METMLGMRSRGRIDSDQTPAFAKASTRAHATPRRLLQSAGAGTGGPGEAGPRAGKKPWPLRQGDGILRFAFAKLIAERGIMQVQPHDLDHEFPEYAKLIHDLKGRDPQLAQLFDEYESVNAQIVDIEENDKPFQDLEFEQMKKRRLFLKDEIYLILRKHHPA
jgi:uncharacterized protein YdcH (DUF465 family)